MKTLFALALGMASMAAAQAQTVPEAAASTRSFSGQFVVFPPPTPGFATPMRSWRNAPGFLTLDPPLLTVSCERIKERLIRQIGARMLPWNGKISIRLYTARTTNAPITCVSERIGSGWASQVTMPDLVEQDRFVRAIVQVILLQIANRRADWHSAEIPAWLAVGMARELTVESGFEFILPPPHFDVGGVLVTPEIIDARRQNPLLHARNELLQRPPLSFQQLSWPTNSELLGPDAEAYRCSAQLFVHQLLDLPDGPKCLREMLAGLPGHYNWQMAFFAAFHDHFQTPLDVEKWWALQLVSFTGRDLNDTWSADVSYRKLAGILKIPVEMHSRPDELPSRATVSLQTALRDWNGVERSQALQRVLRDLNMLRLRVAQQVVPLVDDYRNVIAACIQEQSKSGNLIPFLRRSGISNRSTDETIRKLNALDAQRKALTLPPTPIADAGQNHQQASR